MIYEQATIEHRRIQRRKVIEMENMVQDGWMDQLYPKAARRKNSRNRKRTLVVTMTAMALLSVVFAILASSMLLSHARTHMSKTTTTSNATTGSQSAYQRISTINGLTRISVVGSTAFILDGQGKTISADANPYGVAIVPPNTSASTKPGSLVVGDIVVTNFGANDTGTTLVRFPAGMGPGKLFNTMPNAGTKGLADEAFNTLTGTDWVANISGNNVQVFTPDGKVLTTITSPLFNKPWGQAFNHGMRNPQDGSVSSFFSTNAADATIDRIDVIPAPGLPTFRVFQIGQLARMGTQTFLAVTWIPLLQMNGHRYSDVLLVTDPVMNQIVAYPNSTTRNTTMMKSTDKGITVFKGLPLRMPAGMCINPLNGDLLVVNAQRNDLVELNLSTSKVVGTRMLDNVPVDQMTGNGSALFGVLATKDSKGNLEVYFTDDNTNTLDVLSN
jgi:hypothetical protein